MAESRMLDRGDLDAAARTHEQVGQPLHGWRGFQPLWDEIVAEQPDFLE